MSCSRRAQCTATPTPEAASRSRSSLGTNAHRAGRRDRARKARPLHSPNCLSKVNQGDRLLSRKAYCIVHLSDPGRRSSCGRPLRVSGRYGSRSISALLAQRGHRMRLWSRFVLRSALLRRARRSRPSSVPSSLHDAPAERRPQRDRRGPVRRAERGLRLPPARSEDGSHRNRNGRRHPSSS